MRHGEAQTFAHTDPLRPLTERGRLASIEVAQRVADRGLATIDLALVSPYLRAEQTWKAVQQCITASTQQVEEMITPYGDAENVASMIKATIMTHKPETLILVSHLPLVGYLTAEIVPGIQPPMFPTSTVVCIDYDPDTEHAAIAWTETA